MYLGQEVALQSRKYKKAREEQKQGKKHWKKPANFIIKQKFIIS